MVEGTATDRGADASEHAPGELGPAPLYSDGLDEEPQEPTQMITINADTRIAVLLRENPEALEAIVSLSPRFKKLRDPFMRKLMAPRASIRMASKIGGCTPEDFFAKLEPLGFRIDRSGTSAAPAEEAVPKPEYLKQVRPQDIQEFDVRPILNGGQDPLNQILGRVKSLAPGQVLKIINDFEPIPLIQLLGKQGFGTWTETPGEGVFHTWFYKTAGSKLPDAAAPVASDDFDALVAKHEGRITTIDVRHLEMPLPMHAILDALDQLPADRALFVHHKRIPVFLLPELEERGFEYRAKPIAEGDVKLFIFRP